MELNKIPIEKIKGIGYGRKKLLYSINIKTVEDLLYFKPRGYVDRRKIKKIRELKEGEEVTVMGKVFTKGERRGKGKRMYIVILQDETGFIELVFVNSPYIKDYFPLDSICVVSGKVRRFGSIYQIFHPEFEVLDKESREMIHAGKIVPVYPSIGRGKKRITSKFLRETIHNIFKISGRDINDILPDPIIQKNNLMKRKEALKNLHFPSSYESLKKAIDTLVFEELFLFFLRLFLYRRRKQQAPPFIKKGNLTERFFKILPFELTGDQKKAIRELEISLAKPYSARKLLQGDVGSGKTIVAFFSAIRAIENGYQVAFLAPTEILAEQHFGTLKKFCNDLQIKIGILTGSMSSRQKQVIYRELEKGEIDLILGTHALLEKKVKFKNLGLVIIDEQHKFGVSQRARLLSKGKGPHLIVMTATPIPRTLALTFYGDLDVILIKEYPPGRGEVETVVVYESKREEFYRKLFSQIKKENSKAYIIAPLIEDSEKIDIIAVKTLFEEIKTKGGKNLKIGLIHGRIKREEREEIMKKFKEGELNVIVSTTVIEVGIDVPDVKYMVIEGAERLGLASLHQLRGRIARKIEKGYCFIFCSEDMPPETLKRINAFRKIKDGFVLAEVDLKLRGPGNILGFAQHGFFSFKFADLIKDKDKIVNIREQVKNLLEVDPYLEKQGNSKLKDALTQEQKMWLLEVA